MSTPCPGPETVTATLAALRRGSVDLVEDKKLEARVAAVAAEGRPLRLKFGMDPSSADLHLGHAIPLFKLRDLQEIGHQVVLIVGDSTAMVGDPSGKSKLRPVLTREQVDANLVTYTDQAGRVLDMQRTEVRRNSEWFDNMGFEGLLDLTTRMTVAQMIERDTFQKRLKAGEPVGVNEFLYPLMQAWDSVQVRADIEFGGTDQLFNLLQGRRLQEQEKQIPQMVVTTPLINGLDGRKMSKSYGNAVGLLDSAREMTFSLMRLDDQEMATWFTQLSRLSEEEMSDLLAGHPRAAKARLAHSITSFFHGAQAADAAAASFDREVRDKALPDDIPEHSWGSDWGANQPLAILLKQLGLVASTSDARRMLKQGAVRLDGEVCTGDPMQDIQPPAGELLLQVGKKRFAKLKA